MLKKLSVLLFVAVMATGCIRENLDDCSGLRLSFRYTYNNEHVDRLTVHVQNIHVYAFDLASRLLVDVIDVGPADIARGWVDVDDLPNGRYTFVAWGGSSEDMSRSFSETEMHDATTHDHIDPRIGTTTLDDFYLMLDYDELPGGAVGNIVPAADDFDDLFFAMAGDISVTHGTKRVVDLDFIRDTNVLKVTVTGLEHLWNYNGDTRTSAADQPLRVFVVGRNGRYHWDNTIDPDARLVHYEPPYRTLSADTMTVDIKTMRLDIARHTGDPVLLYVQNAATGHDMLVPLDVVGAITRTRGTRGELLWPDQEAIDRQYEFHFEISILHDLSVRITLDEWVVFDTTPDIGRP